MAKKMIPVKAIDPLAKAEIFTITVDKLGDYEIIIKDTISMADMLGFVEEVVSNIIDLEDDTFYPELKEFFIDAEVLIRYANFKLPSDMSKQYDFIMNNQDIVKTVMAYVNLEQYNRILAAIDERIKHVQAIGTAAITSQFNELVSRMGEYIEQAEATMGDLSAEDISNAVRALGNPDTLDEGKIVKAVFDSQK